MRLLHENRHGRSLVFIGGVWILAVFMAAAGEPDPPEFPSTSLALNNAAPAATRLQIVTVAQFEQAAQIARLAAENGLTELSMRAMARVLHGGVPVEATEAPDPTNPFGQRQQGVPNSEAAIKVYQHLRILEQIWRQKGATDEQIYEVLRGTVFPESRPQEVILYSMPLSDSPGNQPQSVGVLLVKAAILAKKTEVLKSLAQQRLQQPLGEFTARILLGQLALATRDDAALNEQLTLISQQLKHDSLQHSSELACHVALPAMCFPNRSPVAVDVVAQAVDHLHKSIQTGLGRGQQGPVTPLTFFLASHLFQNGKRQDGKQLLESWISLQGPMWSNYGGDYPAYRRKLAYLQAAGELARGGLKSESLEMFGRFADTVTTRDYQVGGPGNEGALILSGLASVEAAQRYDLLKEWTFPTKDRVSVRAVTGLVPADRSPVAFDTIRGSSPRSPQISQLSSSLDLLITAASELGRLDQLQAEMEPHAAAKVENATVALAMIQLANGQGAKALEAVKSLNEIRAKEATDQSQNRRMRIEAEVHDTVLARAALLNSDPAMQEQGRQLAQHFIGYTQRVYDQVMMPTMRHAMRSAQVGPIVAHELDTRMSDTGLKHWVAGSTSSATYDQQGQSLPLWWMAHEGMVSHTCGMGGDYLYFAYPLEGEFELECDGIVGSWAEANIGFGGIVFLGLHGGNNVSIFPVGRRGETIARPDPPEDGGAFNRIKLSVHGDQITYRVNGHPIHVATKVPGTSPFFMLYSERQWDSMFRNIRITGKPVVPREVALIAGTSLLGWACDFYGESQPRFLSPNDYGNNRNDTEPQLDASAFDWYAQDGEVHSRIVAGASLGSAAPMQSRLYYNRPLRDRETLKYEFWYQPGDGGSLTSPALDRLAFLLDSDRVRVHWMTPSNQASDEALLPASNAVIEEGCERGPDKLPLKPNDWNRMELALADGSVVLKLNGVAVYERPIERSNLRQFGFYHDKSRHAVRVRNVVLSGDWPKTLGPAILDNLLEPVRQRTVDERRIMGHVIDEKFHAMGIDHILLRTRALPAEARYAALKDWVLPGDDHGAFRLYGSFAPADTVAAAKISLGPVEDGRTDGPNATGRPSTRIPIRQRHGGELIAPALDLIAIAKELGKLDELETQIRAIPVSSELNERSRKSMLGLTSLAKGDIPAARVQLKALTPERSVGLSDRWQVHERWSEFLLVWEATRVPELRVAAKPLAEMMVDSQNRKSPGGRWEPMVRGLEHRLQQFIAGVDSLSPGSSQSPKRQWTQVTFANADSRGAGLMPVWRFDGNQASHVPGFGNDLLYFQSPLRGSFAVDCELTTFGWRETRLLYNTLWAGPNYTHEKFDVGNLSSNWDGGKIIPKLDPLGEWYRARLEIEPGKATWFANERKYHEVLIPSVADPWLAVHSWGHYKGAVRMLRITGSPEIPAEINITAQQNLDGWWSNMYQESASGDNATWTRSDGEIVGRKYELEQGRYRHSLLQYHRPLLEDGEITFDFFYVPEQTRVHPALGRAAFLLDPDGVKLHWQTDAQFERTGLEPDNVTVEKECQRGGRLLLKSAAWNTMKLAIKGDVLTLSLNDALVYERTIEASNQRQFGLFRYGGDCDVRVKNVIYRGDWPKTLPAVKGQDLASDGVELATFEEDELPARWSWKFQGDPPRDWLRVDSNNVANYHAVKDGTQVLILPDPKRGATTGYQWSNVTFAGDFEITFDYRDFQSSLPSAKSQPWEAPRVELKTGLGDVFDGPKNTHLLAMTHRRRTDESMQLTSLLAILAEPGKFNWQSSDQKAAKPGGRMRIVRRGGSAYYLYAHPGSDDFRLLERKPVPTTDAKGIFVGIRCDHKEDRGSVVLTSLSIRAERLEGSP